MCMLSGVIGYAGAGKKLYEMTKMQEALFGGYYTGICTLNNSTFNLHKCVGPTPSFTSSVQLNAPESHCGIAHSRTKSGGDSGRAQPFVDSAEMLVGMGTGIHGIFAEDCKGVRQKLAEMLESSGVKFTSTDFELGGSATLSDGSTIHNTELVVQAVSHLYQNGQSRVDAIRHVFDEIPGEGAYVFLFKDSPNEMYVANYNLRLLVAHIENSALVVSSTIGLNEDEQEDVKEVEANSIAVVTPRAMNIQKLSTTFEKELDLQLPTDKQLEKEFVGYVKSNPDSTWPTVVEHAMVPLFPSGRANLLMPASFRVAERLLENGRISLILKEVEGVDSGHALEYGLRAV